MKLDKDLEEMLDQIDVDRMLEKQLWDIPYSVATLLSERKAEAELKEIRGRLDFQPRDWFTAIDHSDIVVVGIYGESMYYIQFLVIRMENNAVVLISAGINGGTVERFCTKEKLDSFIEALIQSREKVFGG